MSSIAYVTDEKMIEYYRLCGMRTMNFWRLSSKKEFKDFKQGDLLFFYAKSYHSRKKGFIGYAHYDSVQKLSLKQMWKQYGTANGYDTYEKLEEAIQRAAKDKVIPDKMSCLYLTDAVFFNLPVYPKDVGLQISRNLESYMYLDQEDPFTTIRILRKAEENGIDVWSASQSFEPENIFKQDELRHQLATIQMTLGKCSLKDQEKKKAIKLSLQQLEHKGWEKIRGSATDCAKITKDEIIIAIPFVSQQKNRAQRMQEYIGKIMIYQLSLIQSGIVFKDISFRVLYEDEPPQDILGLVEEINNGK